MERLDILALRNADGPANGQETPEPAQLTNSQRQARWRQNRKIETERMKRIVAKTEKLLRTIRSEKGSEVTLPLNLFTDDTETTLDNLQTHFEHTEQARETARTGGKRTTGGARKK